MTRGTAGRPWVQQGLCASPSRCESQPQVAPAEMRKPCWGSSPPHLHQRPCGWDVI